MNEIPKSTLPAALEEPYQGYTYTYPHKSAYREVMPPRSLQSIWENEPIERRFLYLHIPFCEMRCGFCNLFTVANPKEDVETAYLAALRREAEAVSTATNGIATAPVQIAMGGGTPTYLQPEQLAEVFNFMAQWFLANPSVIPCSIETSPKTATPERLQLIRERGVQRVSIGVQSFLEAEARAMGRPQKTTEVEAALNEIRNHDFSVLNIDLIYGAAEQTVDSWTGSLRRTLDWAPEEVYLYPLYVRPRTGLDGRASVWDAHRLMLYRVGRDFLRDAGYEQISMRHFRKPGDFGDVAGEYSCQEDGMIGLGPGARSYTQNFHYAMNFAVSRTSVMRVLGDYVAKGANDFSYVNHGIALDQAERARRYLLKSILRCEGLDKVRFTELFGREPMAAFPELRDLVRMGLMDAQTKRIVPTTSGLERSDAIGPWLYSASVTERMAAFETL